MGPEERVRRLEARVRFLEERLRALRASRRVLMNLIALREQAMAVLARENDRLRTLNRRYARALLVVSRGRAPGS